MGANSLRPVSFSPQSSPSKNKNIRLYFDIYMLLAVCQEPAVVYSTFLHWCRTSTFVLYLFIMCLDKEHRMSTNLIKENGFTLKKKIRSRQYHAKTIIDADYAVIIVLRSKTLDRVESLLTYLEQAAGYIWSIRQHKQNRVHVFNRKGVISIVNGGPLKLVNNFTYFDRGESSSESDVKFRLAEVWTAIDRLSIIWRPDLSIK